MHSFIIAITTFTAYLLILTIDIVPYQLENHLLIVILSIESIVSIHSLQLYYTVIMQIQIFLEIALLFRNSEIKLFLFRMIVAKSRKVWKPKFLIESNGGVLYDLYGLAKVVL